jgi:hypothetical protein
VTKNHTWVLEVFPGNKKPICCKWVYKVNYKADGTLDKHKARLVTKSFAQKEEIDCEEAFSPTTKIGTIQLALTMAVQFG